MALTKHVLEINSRRRGVDGKGLWDAARVGESCNPRQRMNRMSTRYRLPLGVREEAKRFSNKNNDACQEAKMEDPRSKSFFPLRVS